MARRTNASIRRRGATLIETLVASLLATVVLMGLVRLWSFSYKMTMSTNDKAIAYNLGRQTMERVKGTGFQLTTPLNGSVTWYFDAAGQSGSQTQDATHRYRVVTTLATDRIMVNGSGAQEPAPSALRSVTVTVYLLETGEVVHQTTTNLARAGV